MKTLLRGMGAAALMAVVVGIALADPVVPGATVTHIGTLPLSYRPYTMDMGTDVFGSYSGRWLYFGSDNNDASGTPLMRMRVDGDTAGALHSYAAAVYDPDGIFVDQTGALTGDPGTVLVGASNVSDGAGRVWRIDASANDAGGGFATPHTYVNPMEFLNNCDTMTIDGQGRLYLDVPTHRRIVRMVGLPAGGAGGAGTFETFVTLPASGGSLAYDGQGHIWSSCSDGTMRRMSIEGLGETLPRLVDMEVNLGTGTENGLTWSRATPASGGGAWGGGLLAVRRASGNGQLVRIRVNGAVDVLGSGMGDVYGMRVDDQGVLYTADYTTGQVWKIERQTRLGCGPADVGGPGGFAVPDGTLDNNDFIAFITVFFEGC